MKKEEIYLYKGILLGVVVALLLLFVISSVKALTLDISPRIETINQTVILKNYLNQTLSLNCQNNGSATLTTTLEVNDTSQIDYQKINSSIDYYFKINSDTFNTSKCIIPQEAFLSAYHNRTQTIIERSDLSMQAYITESVIPKQKDLDTIKESLKECQLQKERTEGRLGNSQAEVNNSKELANLCRQANTDYKYAFYGIILLILLVAITLFGGLRWQKKKLTLE